MDELVIGIQNGEQQAFKDAYNLYNEKLYFYLMKCTGSSYLSEEIVQQSFIKIWEKRATLSLFHSFSSQLFRTAKSLLLDTLRKESRERAYKNVVHSLANNAHEDGEKKIIVKEDLSLVTRKIEKLPPVRKQIFRLSREEGLTYIEIANRLSISPKTVENHMLLALKQLRAISIFLCICAGLR
ncbi:MULTISPECIES: RNA polymerase sigma-70 factor [Chitinophagaceae]